MNELPIVAIACAAAVFVYMSVFFILGFLRRNNDIADMAWGLGFILVAAVSYAVGSGSASARGAIVSCLTLLWGLRLAIHIYRRNRGKAEDYRYKAWREKWGRHWVIMSYLQVFLLQGFLMLLISASAMVTNAEAGLPLRALDLAGAAVWCLGFYFESRGDSELARFVKDPANKGGILDTGLWRCTRHPNYFGEMTMWWGIWLIALGAPHGFWAVISPLTITLLLTKVSGVPLLEKRYDADPAYQAYKKRTSVIIPWFPGKKEL